jgi:WD40 repeat protein
MKSLMVLLALLVYQPNCFSQLENNIWYFGANAGLDFSTNPPLLLTNGQLSTGEGCATVSSANGSLLFYSDGVRLWDRSHNIMPNGNSLLGHSSASQAVAIFPSPLLSGQYYVFTLNSVSNPGDLYYSIVDMNLNAGFGDVVAGQKNIFVETGLTEKLVIAKGACALSYWALVHKRNSNAFYAYKIDSNGVSAPVISLTGPVMNKISGYGWSGVMKFSPDFKKVATANSFGLMFLFDFDNATGVLSNPVQLPYTPLYASVPSTYGLCFSPDNNKLYVGEGSTYSLTIYNIYQFDLSSEIAANIVASKTLVGNVSMNAFCQGDLSLGLDGKIYIAKNNIDSLAVIENPNGTGLASAFVDNAISLEGRKSSLGLQNNIVVADSLSSVNCSIALSLLPAPEITSKPNGLETAITMGPVPLKDLFTVQWIHDPPLKIEIYTLDGKMIYQNPTPDQSPLTINFSAIPAGMYLIVIETREKVWVSKISVMKE